MYQQQIGDGFWLAGRKSNGKTVTKDVEQKTGKDWQLDFKHSDVKTAENYGSHFGVNFAKRSHTCHEAVKTQKTSERVRELQQETRKIVSVCLLSTQDIL